jgi:hypothetical protein
VFVFFFSLKFTTRIIDIRESKHELFENSKSSFYDPNELQKMVLTGGIEPPLQLYKN